VTSYRKASVSLKLTTLTLAEIFTLPDKFNVDKPT